MPITYEHPQGGLVTKLSDGRFDVIATAQVKSGEDTSDFIATAPAFKLAGQGETEEDALKSLEAVVGTHLKFFHDNARLAEAFTPPWAQVEMNEGSLAEAIKTLRDNSSCAIHLVVGGQIN